MAISRAGQRKTDGSLCYCADGAVPGSKTRLGHVHGKPLSAREWAKGIKAIAELSRGSRVPWLAGIEKAERQADRILKTGVL